MFCPYTLLFQLSLIALQINWRTHSSYKHRHFISEEQRNKLQISSQLFRNWRLKNYSYYYCVWVMPAFGYREGLKYGPTVSSLTRRSQLKRCFPQVFCEAVVLLAKRGSPMVRSPTVFYQIYYLIVNRPSRSGRGGP